MRALRLLFLAGTVFAQVLFPAATVGAGEPCTITGTAGDGALVAYEGDTGRTWRLDPVTSVWSSGHRGPALRRIGWEATGGEIANDDAAGLVVVFGDDRVIGYDAAVDAWQTLYDEPGHAYTIGPLARDGHWLVYDPVNERLVVMGGQAYVDGEWTETDGEDDGWVSLDDTNGAFADGQVDFVEVQELLFSVLEGQGNPVSLDVMPGSTHTWLSRAGWEVFLSAFRGIAAQDD